MKLVEINGLFEINYGAPCPLIISNDDELSVVFYINNKQQGGLKQRNVVYDEGIIELKFKFFSFHSFGPPNDEALDGHPYYELGLMPCGFYELLESDVIEKLSKLSRYHPFYNPKAYDDSRHYILTFKERIFECVADSYEIITGKESLYNRALTVIHQMYGGEF